MEEDDEIDRRAQTYKALGHPLRLRILSFLLERDECNCICALTEMFRKDQSVIYRHLMILRDAGLIRTRKKERCLYCCIIDKDHVKRLLEG